MSGWKEPDRDQMDQLLSNAKTIAIVGVSENADRPSNDIARYLLQTNSYELYFVNPAIEELFGQKVYPRLADIPVPIDIVDVFRRTADLPQVFAEAVPLKPRSIWLQLGLADMAGAELATEQGIQVVMDRCIKVEHRRMIKGL